MLIRLSSRPKKKQRGRCPKGQPHLHAILLTVTGVEKTVELVVASPLKTITVLLAVATCKLWISTSSQNVPVECRALPVKKTNAFALSYAQC